MPSVFRRPWSYAQLRIVRKIGLPVLNNTTGITGQAATTDFTRPSIAEQGTFTGVAATSQIGTPVASYAISITGQAATTAFNNLSSAEQDTLTGVVAISQIDTPATHYTVLITGQAATAAAGTTFHLDKELGVLTGQPGVTATGSFGVPISSNISLTSDYVTAAVGTPQGDHPGVLVQGVSVITAVPVRLFESFVFDLFGLFVTTKTPAHPFFGSPDIDLRGIQVIAIAFSAAGAGGGGGGSAGLYGPGSSGFGGAATGEGGRGGDADNHLVLGAIISGSAGTSGTEISPSVGSGSGGAGAAFQIGANLTTYNYNGTVFLSYISTITNTLKFVTLTTANNASSPFRIPNDWSNSNVVSLTGSGCTNHGDTALFNNVTNFNAGDFVAFFCSAYCSELQTTFGPYSASSGVNAPVINGNIGGDGGLYGGGGGGGTGGGGGRGGDGVIFVQYRSSFDHLIHTTVLHVADNGNSPFHIPTDWTDSDFVYLQGSGGCGDTGSPRQGGDGGGGGGVTGGFDTSAFNPGDVVPFFVSPGCSGLPTIFGPFAARSGLNGGQSPESGFGLLDHFQIVLPCNGSTGDGTVGPTRPPSSVLVE